MRRLLARLQQLRHRLSVSRSIHASTSKHEQEAHDPIQGQQPRRFRQAPPSTGRFRRQQSRPNQESGKQRREVKLPTFRPRVQSVEVPTKARREQKRFEPFGLYVNLVIINLITLGFILAIPSPPPLPQPHDCPAPEAQS